jgi:23S rRNA pseudouridine955/2504/2580 synthase
MNGERFITVKDDDDGQRFDRWIKKNAPEIPYVLVQKLVRKGAFKIDGKKAKGDTKLNGGASVRIPAIDNIRPRSERSDRKDRLSEKDKQFMHSMVIYQDADIIAINKPHGLAVQGGTKTEHHLDRLLPALENEEGVAPRLVHRLDKDTSGVMLLARSAKVAAKLGAAFKGRDIRKVYWAILHGVPDPREGSIKAPLIKAGGLNKERMRVDEKEGKFAWTEYAVLDHALGHASFVAFWPRTGRTHQIRAHAELLGNPIVGDGKYSGRGQISDHDGTAIERDEELSRQKQLHLHAQRLVFKHPITGKRMDIKAPLPTALQKSWKAMGFETNYKDDPFTELET